MRFPLEVLVSGLAAAGAATTTWFLIRSRRDPASKERKRCAMLSAHGRLIEGMVSDFANGVVYYSYSWRGVDYEAAQDVRTTGIELPASPDALVGPVTVKFLPRDASNSIVLSSTWSGFPRLRLLPPEQYQAQK
jgi:hypothetical protein